MEANSTFNIENISVFVPTGAPPASEEKKDGEKATEDKKVEMPKAPAMPLPPMPKPPTAPTTDSVKKAEDLSLNVDAPVFVFDPSKAFVAPAAPAKEGKKKNKAKNPETAQTLKPEATTEERSTSSKRVRKKKVVAPVEATATEYKAKAPANVDESIFASEIPMPLPPVPTQAVKSGYTNRHKQAETTSSVQDEEKARVTAEK